MFFSQRVLFLALLFCVVCLGAESVAKADNITSNTIVIVQGTMGGGVSDSVSAGTFTFIIPSGHTITAASLVGSAQYQLVSGAQIGLILDGNSVSTLTGTTASTPINLSLNPSIFSTLADGSSVFTLNRVGGTFGGSYNLFSLQLQLVTAPSVVAAPVPEPATMGMLATGVLSLAGAAWRRRKTLNS
jgi:hypothetical protein